MLKAVVSGKWPRIEPLLQQHGPGLAAADLGDGNASTALHFLAAQAPDVPASAESIQHLAAIEAVNVDAIDSAGATPLHYASVNGRVHHVLALLRCGAIADTEAYDGKTPMSSCCKLMTGVDQANTKAAILAMLRDPPRDNTDTTPKCSECGRPGATSNCSRCKSTFYCNRACQKRHWKKHKKMCKKKRSANTASATAASVSGKAAAATFTEKQKYEMHLAAKSGEWSRMEPLLQQHGPGLAAADLDGHGSIALHFIACNAPDVPARHSEQNES